MSVTNACMYTNTFPAVRTWKKFYKLSYPLYKKVQWNIMYVWNELGHDYPPQARQKKKETRKQNSQVNSRSAWQFWYKRDKEAQRLQRALFLEIELVFALRAAVFEIHADFQIGHIPEPDEQSFAWILVRQRSTVYKNEGSMRISIRISGRSSILLSRNRMRTP